MAVTVNIDSQIVVKTAAQWAADSTVYSSQRILVTSDATYTNSDQRKFKIADGVQTWSNLDYMPIAQTLAEVLANDNDTNNLHIVSPNGKSSAQIENQFIRLLHDDGNDSELYLHSADATLKTATGGFYVNETALTDTKFIQIKSASTTIQHNTTISVNTPNVNLPQETASRIAIFDSSKNVKAANTATYPNLTELSYVKGVTSAIQTQLNGKQDLNGGVTVIYRDFTTSAALTGTTAITLINSALIPANTVAVNDEVEIKARAQRNTTSGTSTHYLYFNTSASLSGATLIGSVAAAGGYFATVRSFFVKSSTDSETSNSALGIASTDAATGGAVTTVSNFNIDWTSDVYIIQAFANAAVGNSTTSQGIIIKRSRL